MKSMLFCAGLCLWLLAQKTFAQPNAVDITLSTTTSPMNAAIHGGNLEAAHYDKKNFFIDWYAGPYLERCRLMNFTTYSWPGSSVSHSLYFLPGDTVATGAKRVGNGFNGKYLYWGEAPCSPVQKQGYLVNKSVLDGVNCIDWGISFAPYAVNWVKEVNATMITVINANDYDWRGNKSFLSWSKKKGVYSGIVVAGLELGGNNYSNKTDFPNGGVDYVNNVVNPLCDSMKKNFPGSLVVADINPPQRGSKNNWNRAVADSKADAVRAYLLSSDLTYLSESANPKARVDSIDRAVEVYLPQRLDLFRSAFPDKKLYIHQWQCTWQPIRGTILDVIYCARYTNAIARYDQQHPGYIIANCFNGNGRINLERKTPRVSYYALVQQGKLFLNGAKWCEVKVNNPGLDCIASRDANGYHLRIVNTTASAIAVSSLTVDGKKVADFSGESFYADTPESKTILSKKISGKEIPPFSDTVIDFK
jgi:hypothetical protein